MMLEYDYQKHVVNCKECLDRLLQSYRHYLDYSTIKCNAEYVDGQLAADSVQVYLEEGVEPEVFIPKMYEDGYDMEIFEK